MITEVCANSYASALAAQNAGANRIELCTELAVGGVTPSWGLIQKVATHLTIPIHVLIRPRSGNFTYTPAELDIMTLNINYCMHIGCSGVVSGALNRDNTLDVSSTKQLVAAAGAMEFTFHRAIDSVPNRYETLEQLIELGVHRVLSSGQQAKAIDGINLLVELKKLAAGRIEIMPGGGINAQNAAEFQKAGFDMIHFSATKKRESNTLASPTRVSFDTNLTVSDENLIREIISVVD